jgi:hypothetical protein
LLFLPLFLLPTKKVRFFLLFCRVPRFGGYALLI